MNLLPVVRRLALFLVALQGGGTACSERGQPGRAAALAGGTGHGTVVIAGSGGLGRLNPLVATDRWTREVNRFMLFLPLVELGPDGGYAPRLAEGWELLGDSGAVFRLRRDVRWHDGRPTTAHDVAFTLGRAMDPASAFPNADFVAPWTHVEPLDSFTLRLRYRPHVDPLAALAYLPVVPKHHLESVPPNRVHTAAFNQAPVGNGPFRYVTHSPNDRWVFQANSAFPVGLGGRPPVDRVVWRAVPEASARITELLTGRAHLIVAPPPEQHATLDARPGIRTLARDGGLYTVVAWNTRRPPLDDPRVRRAMTLAIDRHALVDGLRAGIGTVAAGPVGPGHWAHDPSLEPLPYDPTTARALLAEAGLVDGIGNGTLQDATGAPLRIELRFAADIAFQRNAVQLIQRDLAAVGVEVIPRAIEFGTLIDQISAPEKPFHAVFVALESDLRIDLRDLFHSARVGGPFQLASYANPEADRLMDAAAAASSREQAVPLYHRLLAILQDDQPWSFLYHYPELFAHAETLRGVAMDARGALITIDRWHLGGDAAVDEP